MGATATARGCQQGESGRRLVGSPPRRLLWSALWLELPMTMLRLLLQKQRQMQRQMQRRDEQEQRCRRAETPRQVSWTRHRRSLSSSRRLSPWEARPDPCNLDLLSLTRSRLDAVSHLASPLLPPIHPRAPGCSPCSRSTLSLRPGPTCRSPGHPRRQARSWTAPQAGKHSAALLRRQRPTGRLLCLCLSPGGACSAASIVDFLPCLLLTGCRPEARRDPTNRGPC